MRLYAHKDTSFIIIFISMKRSKCIIMLISFNYREILSLPDAFAPSYVFSICKVSRHRFFTAGSLLFSYAGETHISADGAPSILLFIALHEAAMRARSLLRRTDYGYGLPGWIALFYFDSVMPTRRFMPFSGRVRALSASSRSCLSLVGFRPRLHLSISFVFDDISCSTLAYAAGPSFMPALGIMLLLG